MSSQEKAGTDIDDKIQKTLEGQHGRIKKLNDKIIFLSDQFRNPGHRRKEPGNKKGPHIQQALDGNFMTLFRRNHDRPAFPSSIAPIPHRRIYAARAVIPTRRRRILDRGTRRSPAPYIISIRTHSSIIMGGAPPHRFTTPHETGI